MQLLDNERYWLAKYLYHIGEEYLTDTEYAALEAKIKKDDPDNELLSIHYSQVPVPIEILKKIKREDLIDSHTVLFVTEGMDSLISVEDIMRRTINTNWGRLSYKMDGFHIDILYVNGSLVKILTRGTSGSKKDLSFLKAIIPETIDHMGNVVVSGELTIPTEEWIKLKNETGQVSQRSSVSTAIARQDCSYLSFFAFAYRYEEQRPEDIVKEYERLRVWGFTTPPAVVIRKQISEQTLDKLVELMGTDPFVDLQPTDGLVFETNSDQFAIRIGHWEEAAMNSTIIEFIEEPGLHKLTPIAIIEPVTYNERVFSRVSLQNQQVVADLELKIGSKIAFDLKAQATVSINRELTKIINGGSDD